MTANLLFVWGKLVIHGMLVVASIASITKAIRRPALVNTLQCLGITMLALFAAHHTLSHFVPWLLPVSTHQIVELRPDGRVQLEWTIYGGVLQGMACVGAILFCAAYAWECFFSDRG